MLAVADNCSVLAAIMPLVVNHSLLLHVHVQYTSHVHLRLTSTLMVGGLAQLPVFSADPSLTRFSYNHTDNRWPDVIKECLLVNVLQVLLHPHACSFASSSLMCGCSLWKLAYINSTYLSGRSSRTEKYLAACASGKWVLNKSYMEACRGEGRFVEVRYGGVNGTSCIIHLVSLHVHVLHEVRDQGRLQKVFHLSMQRDILYLSLAAIATCMS